MSSSIDDEATSVSISAATFHNEVAAHNDAVSSTAVTIMTTVLVGRTGENDINLYLDTVFDGCTGNNTNYYGETVSISIIVTLITYDTFIDLYYETAFNDNDGNFNFFRPIFARTA